MTLWRFTYVDQWGKRQTTRYRLTEQEALERYGPTAEKVEWSRMEIVGSGSNTGDFLRGSAKGF